MDRDLLMQKKAERDLLMPRCVDSIGFKLTALGFNNKALGFNRTALGFNHTKQFPVSKLQLSVSKL